MSELWNDQVFQESETFAEGTFQTKYWGCGVGRGTSASVAGGGILLVLSRERRKGREVSEMLEEKGSPSTLVFREDTRLK